MAKKFDLGESMPETIDTISTPETVADGAEPVVDTTTNGLDDNERKDPNSIAVTIADKDTPIVVLFGPAACGKTMTLVRLTRFLQEQGYSVSPVKSFRPAKDAHYAKMCEEFNTLVYSNNAADSTDMISFILLEVLDSTGKRVCQILEAPGEYYFSPDKPKAPFPAYVNTIKNSKNRKIWLCMVEPNWKDATDRSAYVERVKMLSSNLGSRDKVVFLYNKVDITNYVGRQGKVNMVAVSNDVHNMYPGLFVPFANVNPITKWFRPFDCELIPFSNGDFTEATASDGSVYQTWQQGTDFYPGMLWKNIMSKIRG